MVKERTGNAAHLQAAEVPAVEPGHQHQPEADRRRRRQGRQGPGHRRRALDRGGRDRARQEPGGRLHAVGGPQLRGRDHPVRAARQGRRAHLDPHRGARGRRPRHQARRRGDHPRHPQRLRGDPEGPRRARASCASGPRSPPATTWSARSRPKGETELTPEERLLRAIFGEKAREVRDTSLKVPHGESGQGHRRPGVQPRRRRRAAARREPAGPRLRGPEAQDLRRRQAGRPPREQGRHLDDPARGGHAVPPGRHAGRHHPEPARRPEPR